MWRRKPSPVDPSGGEEPPSPLRDALRRARIEQAERTGVVVDLRDAEIARLDLLNEALDPLFAGVPEGVEVFDRGISHGDTPRLWIDVVAHVGMGRDKRTYRFLQDTRFGRRVIAESPDTAEIVEAVTRYVAQRLIERERALAGDRILPLLDGTARSAGRRRAARTAGIFVLGMVCGTTLLLLAAYLVASGMHGR